MLKKLLLERFKEGSFDQITLKSIMKRLDFHSAFEKKELEKALGELESEGEIYKDGFKRYSTPSRLGIVKGKIKGHERGFAFLIPEDKEQQDLFLPHKNLGGAMHGDTVFALKTSSERSSDEGRVIKVIERGFKNIVGTFIYEGNHGFVRPDDKNYFSDIFIALKNMSNAKTGEKVVAKIISYPFEPSQKPGGIITEVLGRQFAKDAEEKSIIKAFGLPDSFAQKVLAEAEKVSAEALDLNGRKDFRDSFVFTIDGEDAKDLDDAVSIEKTKNGYRLAVHIADVTHYVKLGGNLDKEALSRGTSVYFPELVLPMLPEKISNGVCSLNANEDKLTLSCIMDVDLQGNVRGSEFARAVIRSKHRLTYTDVAAVLDGDITVINKYKDAAEHILTMGELTDILIKKRERRGSIDLDMKEAQIVVNSGSLEITELKRTKAHRLIEEFMILANECAAEFLYNLNFPSIYRIHEKPSSEKLTDFITFIKELGYKVKWREDSVHSKDFQAALKAFEGSSLFTLVNKVMLRAMAKAKYHTVNIGHFGLSSECYCHFTAPIRRYPDLFVHRAIKSVIDGKAEQNRQILKEAAGEAAKISSEKERNADEAERAMDDLYKARYMSERKGQEFDAVISGVQPFGVFAELDNTIEGLIKIDTLPMGRYDYDEKRFLLKSSKLSLKLGDKVRVKVVAANASSRKIEFVLVEKTSKNI